MYICDEKANFSKIKREKEGEEEEKEIEFA